MLDVGEFEDVQINMERLLLLNINQNFQLVKADFSAPLALILEYLQVTTPTGALKSVGLPILYKLSQGTSNLV